MRRTHVMAARLLAVVGCLGLVACGGSTIIVNDSVLDVHVSGTWSGDLRSPRSLVCIGVASESAWVGTLGDRVVKLELIGVLGARPGTVRIEGGASGGRTMDPYVPGSAPQENTVAASLVDELSTEEHALGGTVVIAADRRSGRIDLHDADLRVTGTWRC